VFKKKESADLELVCIKINCSLKPRLFEFQEKQRLFVASPITTLKKTLVIHD
jgi:hypothetical protein